MPVLFSNNAVSSLQVSINASASSITVATADAAAFPQPVLASDYFMLTLENYLTNPVSREIVKCTSRTGNALTVIRAQEGTTAAAFPSGSTVSHRLTAAILASFVQGILQSYPVYLGSFSTAPTAGFNNAPLVSGNLYYNTASGTLFVYSGAAWASVSPGSATGVNGLYLGAFASAPTTMLNGTTLVVGALYYDTSVSNLYVWNGTTWVVNTSTTSSSSSSSLNQSFPGNVYVGGSETVQGDLRVNGTGYFTNIVVSNDTATHTLHLNGALVVNASDVSGSANIQKFPDGNTLQWGSGSTSSGGTAVVTFPTPYSSTPTSAQATLYNNGTNVVLRISAITSTSLTVFVEDTNNTGGITGVSFFWQTIGVV